MERLAFIGFENKSAITEKYAAAADLCFDPPCESAAQCFEFSAAFIKSGAPGGVLQRWLLNEHPRLAADENALFAEVNAFLGIPRPLEIERKFLIERPAEASFSSVPHAAVEISQAYVEKNGERFRLRKRGCGESFVYIKTQKEKLSDMVRIEREERVGREYYERNIRGARLLEKRRVLFFYNDKSFEADIFPFWRDTALLEIELLSEDEKFALPPFLNVIKEVTADKRFRNSALAALYGAPQA